MTTAAAVMTKVAIQPEIFSHAGTVNWPMAREFMLSSMIVAMIGTAPPQRH